MTDLVTGKNYYFASDFHLGLKAGTDPLIREKHVVNWLSSIEEKADAIFLVGDLFDFWWEYSKVVPKGFTRFLGKISELTDRGIKVHFFTGNHDMWVGDYLSSECGMIIHRGEYRFESNGKRFYIAHGEGLGIRETGYKILLWIFRNRFLQSLYSAIHPRIGIGIGQSWSENSRLAKNYTKEFMGEADESLFRHAAATLSKEEVDFFIFGHRHLALDRPVGEKSRLLILGNWFNAPVYAEWNGIELVMHDFPYR
ncbi:MAG: UDP-2,3-diacylglucosamine diphosphatase [Bacteroidales bacterium]